MAPTLHDFKFLRDIFPENQLSDSWEIITLKSDDVIWNIVLAYLHSFSLSNKNELTQRMKCLMGHQKVNENIKNSIELCNPFLHHSACFCDKVMFELINVFKERVEDYIKNDKILFHTTEKLFPYLEASSNLLSCNIVLLSKLTPNKIGVIVFPVQILPYPRKVYSKYIAIFEEFIFVNTNESPQEKFSFCIPKEIGIEKQREALTEILKRTKLIDSKEKMIQKISRLPDISENFLVSLLKNGIEQAIPFIFDSPYALLKLADAGFKTDPRTRDPDGKSAFFHALKTEKPHLVSLLYDHAANACLQTDASVRSPDPLIVENLLCLKDHLKLLEKDFESDEVNENSRFLFQNLCRFNEFQIEMCRSINNIRLMINYYDHIKDFEVMQRKDIILAISTTYESYFDYVNRDVAPSLTVDGNISLFSEFNNHKDYFDKLDFSSAVMFFDNLFLLKERLKLPNNAYLNIESKFFLFIFFRKYLEQYEKEKRFYFVSRWIIFQERLSLRTHICKFQKILEQTEVIKDNIADGLPETTVRTLTNLPEIYGQFLIVRLQHYLNAATELAVGDLKSILVIERCLQVLGECFKESDFNSVQRILTLGLPSDFVRNLKQIRNLLANLKIHELPYRSILEQDTELFIGIKNDLSELRRLLQPIYSIHKHQLDSFLLLHSIKSVYKALKSISEAVLSSPEELEENQYRLPENIRGTLWKRSLEEMRTSLEEKIDDLNYKGNILNKSKSNLYKYVVQNMILAAKDVLRNSARSDPEKIIEGIQSHFWCLESALIYMTKDRKLAEYRSALSLLFENRKSLFTEFKRKFCPFHRTGKQINSNINGSSNEENAINENCSSSEPKDSYDNSQKTMNSVETSVKFDAIFNIGSSLSTSFDEKEANGSLPKGFECSEISQLMFDDIKRKFENNASENAFHANILQQTICEKEIEEVVDISEKAESSRKEIQSEGNDLKFSQVISKTPDDVWLLPNVFDSHFYYPVDNEAEGTAEVKNFARNSSENSKFNSFMDRIANILDDYEKLSDSFFQKIPGRKNADFHFKSIEKYCLILKGWTFLNKTEKAFIVQSVPKKFRSVPELKQKIKALLKRETNFTEEIKAELFKLNLKSKDQKEIVENIERQLIDDANRIVDSAPDYFSELKSLMELKKIDKSKYTLLCEKLQLADDAKDILLKLVPGQNKKVAGNQFEFLRNRIKKLKNILIDENSAIQPLWERATTPRRKMHVKEKIVQLYLKDSQIQASVEMLLFDCMTILSSKKLKNLWKKTTNLFNGVNLRNVLAHGHPLLESLGRLLDPYDLPSELVEKMLKLISDEYAIECMQQILEQSGTDLAGFMHIMYDEDDERYKNLREQILECDHWKDYAVLIPFD